MIVKSLRAFVSSSTPDPDPSPVCWDEKRRGPLSHLEIEERMCRRRWWPGGRGQIAIEKSFVLSLAARCRLN